MPVRLLTAVERERLYGFPKETPTEDLHSFFTLTGRDRDAIPATSAPANRLGFALSLCAGAGDLYCRRRAALTANLTQDQEASLEPVAPGRPWSYAPLHNLSPQSNVSCRSRNTRSGSRPTLAPQFTCHRQKLRFMPPRPLFASDDRDVNSRRRSGTSSTPGI